MSVINIQESSLNFKNHLISKKNHSIITSKNSHWLIIICSVSKSPLNFCIYVDSRQKSSYFVVFLSHSWSSNSHENNLIVTHRNCHWSLKIRILCDYFFFWEGLIVKQLKKSRGECWTEGMLAEVDAVYGTFGVEKVPSWGQSGPDWRGRLLQGGMVLLLVMSVGLSVVCISVVYNPKYNNLLAAC